MTEVNEAQRNTSTGNGNSALLATDPSNLNVDQRQAHGIIIWHLDQDLAGLDPPPLRLDVQGEGGTGKSKVLQTVSQGFEDRGCKYRLLKAAECRSRYHAVKKVISIFRRQR